MRKLVQQKTHQLYSTSPMPPCSASDSIRRLQPDHRPNERILATIPLISCRNTQPFDRKGAEGARAVNFTTDRRMALLRKRIVLLVLLSSAAGDARLPALQRSLALRGGGPVSDVALVKSPKDAYLGMAAKGRDNAKLPVSAHCRRAHARRPLEGLWPL